MRPLILDLIYNDDRMYILELTKVQSRELTSDSPAKLEWAVITRRNVFDYPPVRCDNFDTRQEASEYYMKVVVETPRVSLDEKSPIPVPSLEEYTAWLLKEDLHDQLLNPRPSR